MEPEPPRHDETEPRDTTRMKTPDETDTQAPTRPAIGDHVELTLESLGHGGEAVARHEGLVYFVAFGAPGDRVDTVVTEVRRSFARARIRRILDPSKLRHDPPCAYFGACGGCHLQHMTYDAQVDTRAHVVRDALERLAGLRSPHVDACVPSPSPLGYRHRVTLHARAAANGEVSVGFVGVGGTGIVRVGSCHIAHPSFAPVIDALPAAAREAPGVAGRIDLRTGYPSRGVHVHLGRGAEELASPLLRRLQTSGAERNVTIFWREGNVTKCAPRANPAPIRIETPWATWALPHHAFYQANPALAVELARKVAELAALSSSDVALDLYAGVGFLAAPLATNVQRVWCLESGFAAVRAGQAAMRRAGLDTVRFVPGPVEYRLPTMNIKGSLAAVILDPPREGLAKKVLHTLIKLAPLRIVYVSCEPATLARDVKWLVAGGFRHVRSIPYDLFPQTYHIESVTLLEKA